MSSSVLLSSFSPFLKVFATSANYSFLQSLQSSDPYIVVGKNNFVATQRPTRIPSGHYVSVVPTPLPDPKLISVNYTLLADIFGNNVEDDIEKAAVHSNEFLQFFSGDGGSMQKSNEMKSNDDDGVQQSSNHYSSSSVIHNNQNSTTETAEEGGAELTQGTCDAPALLQTKGWATGYALSIMGTEQYLQCPFHDGNGYGDGRAISILEILKDQKTQNSPTSSTTGQRRGDCWEFQLKGAGKTPYCRGGDGRCVLRSSVREFLASEAMHALGVKTCRPLSLIVSGSESVLRPWYTKGNSSSYASEPDILIREPTAITTRVAPSFIRIGQIELFARRARKHEHPNALEELQQIVKRAMWCEYGPELPSSSSLTSVVGGKKNEENSSAFLVTPEFKSDILTFLELYSTRLCHLLGDWIRVGYCQGNFNSDNCQIGGRTLDYGPFGFMEQFDPNYQPWSGGGEHFSFLRGQPTAAAQNFKMLCFSMQPLLLAKSTSFSSSSASSKGEKNVKNNILDGDDNPPAPRQDSADDKEKQTSNIVVDESTTALLKKLQQTLQNFPSKMDQAIEDCFREKLGFTFAKKPLDKDLLSKLLQLMTLHPIDWTIFWRELSEKIPDSLENLGTKPFYPLGRKGEVVNVVEGDQILGMESIPSEIVEKWNAWLKEWHHAVVVKTKEEASEKEEKKRRKEEIPPPFFINQPQGGSSAAAGPASLLSQAMCKVNPKYVPREWMLVKAYQDATQRHDYTEIHRLQELFKNPYDDPPEQFFADKGGRNEKDNKNNVVDGGENISSSTSSTSTDIFVVLHCPEKKYYKKAHSSVLEKAGISQMC